MMVSIVSQLCCNMLLSSMSDIRRERWLSAPFIHPVDLLVGFCRYALLVDAITTTFCKLKASFSINSRSDSLMQLFSTDFASSYSMFQMLKGGYVLSIHSQQPIYFIALCTPQL